MAKRYQVFISSTYVDLIPERSKVIEQILTMGHIPVGMEMFSADDAEQWEVIQREIDQSDYYIVIVKQRYGSTIKAENGIGFTEKEYDYAGTVNLPRLGFIVSDDVLVKPDFMEASPAGKKKLKAFKKKVMKKPVSTFHSPEELGTQVLQALTKQIAKGNRPGWERATEDSEHALASFARLSDENSTLRSEIERLRSVVSAQEVRLNCEFVDEDGARMGPHVISEAPNHTEISKFMADNLLKINNWIQNIDLSAQTDRKIKIFLKDNFSNRTTSLAILSGSKHPYQFDPRRLTIIRELLTKWGANEPQIEWKFDNLSTLFISLPGIGGGRSEPDDGDNIRTYKAFKELEDNLIELEQTRRSLLYLSKHRTFNLKLLNVGKAPAEDLTVRLDFQGPVAISLSPVDSVKQPTADVDTQYMAKIQLISAADEYYLPPFTIKLDENPETIFFDVRITGRSLQQARVIPMQIVIREPTAAKPET